MPRSYRDRLLRKAQIEVMEERLALTVQPWGSSATDAVMLEHHSALLDVVEAPNTPALLSSAAEIRIEQHLQSIQRGIELSEFPDFRLDTSWQPINAAAQGNLTPQLNDVHGISGLTYVRNNYGFNGAGQTVAIIDSGIAYDHHALGRGFGTGYRVVGGWDFAEGDANPYDDGPSGFHGTHVAGIVGSSNTTYQGVASGVDLVALRVFDDNGAGYFSWVENALQWVHQHRNDYRFPITTVNMSIGSDWNSNTIPGWANLEDEFAQLRADGIFIAVSAGNSFTSYNVPGLSYPAASPEVVPVASIDNSGTLSSFSQRNSRVIAAPGRTITSTVPDYLYGADGVVNDFGTASGTSMAAPYVAGASALVRQAMSFVGRTNINQDAIYDHLRNTGDNIVDSATNATYKRLNLQSAISSLMPADEVGTSIATAQSLGTVSSAATFRGTIGSFTDADYFRFTAGSSGNVAIQFTTTHNLAINAALTSGGVSQSNNVLSFSAVAGQTYTIALNSTQGIGHYVGNIQFQQTPPTAPGAFHATAASPTQVQLTWSDSVGETDYWIYQWINGQSTYIDGVAANTTSYTVNGLTPGSLNHFYVVAHNSAGIAGSGWQAATTAPSAPGNFSATPMSSSEVLLTWSDSVGESDFGIYQWLNGQSTYIDAVGANVTNYRVRGLNGGTHHFYVVARNSGGTNGSGWRQVELSAPTAPSLSLQAVSQTQVQLSWSDSAGETEYWVYQWLNGQSTYITGLSANTTSYTATGLTPGQTHHFYLVAVNSLGQSGSGWQSIDSAVPSAPTNLSIAPVSANQALLTWSDTNGELGYRVYQWINGQSTFIANLSANTTHYVAGGLATGQTHNFYVVAYNGLGESGGGWQQVAMTAPTAPSLSLSSPSPNQVRLNWTDSAGESAYWVYQWLNGQSMYVAGLNANTTSYTVNGVAAGQTHFFFLVAHNAIGNNYSGWQQITIPGATTQGQPATLASDPEVLIPGSSHLVSSEQSNRLVWQSDVLPTSSSVRQKSSSFPVSASDTADAFFQQLGGSAIHVWETSNARDKLPSDYVRRSAGHILATEFDYLPIPSQLEELATQSFFDELE